MQSLPPTTGTRERYASEVGELWSGLTRKLSRLEALAEAPDRLEEGDLVASLRRLQYALHSAAEQAYGIAPPAGSERAHAELATALDGARDATAAFTAAVDERGFDTAQALVPEWRGALFRLRLARLRLTSPGLPATQPELPGPAAALAAVTLSLGGAVVFLCGALLASWPLWLAGVVALAASFIIYKPYP
jgi:hypothetical protein